MTTTSPSSSPVLLVALAAVLAFPACGEAPLAKVGRTRLDRADLEVFVARSGRAATPDAAALTALAERQLLAEAARRAGLDDDPALAAELQAVVREHLAHAYLERELARATGEAALRARYEADRDSLSRQRIHVRHVLVRIPEGEKGLTQARSRIHTAYARLKGGEAFGAVARDLSDDPVSAAKDGDLGPILQGEVDEAFFAEAAALAPGELSAPFESPYGLHVVQGVEAAETVTPDFAAARGRLAARLRAEAREAVLDRLRAEIPVSLHPEQLEPVEAGR